VAEISLPLHHGKVGFVVKGGTLCHELTDRTAEIQGNPPADGQRSLPSRNTPRSHHRSAVVPCCCKFVCWFRGFL